MKKLWLIIIVPLLMYASCINDATKQDTDTVKYYPNGIVFSKIVAKKGNDSEWVMVRYYIDGSIMDSTSYKNGKKNGICVMYSSMGGYRQYVSQYKNDKLHGWNREYYENGTLKKEQLFFHDQEYGSSLTFFENGLPHIYYCFDFAGHNGREKEYDREGNVIENKGLLLEQSAIYSPTQDETFKVGQQVFIENVVSTPPHEKIKVWMYLEGDKKKSLVDVVTNTAQYRKVFDKEGDHVLITIGESVDTLTGRKMRDTLRTKFKIVR